MHPYEFVNRSYLQRNDWDAAGLALLKILTKFAISSTLTLLEIYVFYQISFLNIRPNLMVLKDDRW